MIQHSFGKQGEKIWKSFIKVNFWRTGLVVITRWRSNLLSVKRDVGTMRKRSLIPGIDFKASITEHPQRQGPVLDGHLLFSFVLIKSKEIFAQKCTHFFSFYCRIFWVCLYFGLQVFCIRGYLFLKLPCYCFSAPHMHILRYSKWCLLLTRIPLNLLPILLAISLTLKKQNLTKSVGTFFVCFG